jgi:hypothetical protein
MEVQDSLTSPDGIIVGDVQVSAISDPPGVSEAEICLTDPDGYSWLAGQAG